MTTILEFVDKSLKVFIWKDEHNEKVHKESQKRNGNHKKERNGNSRTENTTLEFLKIHWLDLTDWTLQKGDKKWTWRWQSDRN